MKYILFFFISLQVTMVSSQIDSATISDKKQKSIHFSAGTDLFAPISSLFSDRSGYSILLNIQLFPKWFVQSQIGYGQNRYKDIGWDVNVNGSYFKLGANYIITQHKKLPENQFYIGGKIAYSSFVQDLKQVPIRAIGQTTQYVSLGDDHANAYWFELPVGARISIWKEKLYLESIFTTNILIHASSDLNIPPVVIPNFGRNNGNLNFNIFWGLTYILK